MDWRIVITAVGLDMMFVVLVPVGPTSFKTSVLVRLNTCQTQGLDHLHGTESQLRKSLALTWSKT